MKRLAKPAVFIAAVSPFLWLVFRALTDRLSVNPVEDLTLTTGIWALRMLVVTLAITPLRRLTGWNRLVQYRRMLGLFAFFYGLLHLVTYFVFIRSVVPAVIVRDVIEHPYVAIGMASLIMMIPLAITSTNAAVKRLGAKNWKRLHRLAYTAAIAGVIHYWMLVKADVSLPAAFTIAIGILLLVRLVSVLLKQRGRGVAPGRGFTVNSP